MTLLQSVMNARPVAALLDLPGIKSAYVSATCVIELAYETLGIGYIVFLSHWNYEQDVLCSRCVEEALFMIRLLCLFPQHSVKPNGGKL